MRKKNLESVYDRLRPEERFRLVLEAAARQDESEVERLAGTCPRYRYTSVRTDHAFTDFLGASRQIAVCVAFMLMKTSAKLMVIRTSQESMALVSRSLAIEVERGYLRGWEAGCDHAWLSAGMAGPFPWREDGDPAQEVEEIAEALACEDQNVDADGDDELDAGAKALATEVATLWEAFSRVCRAQMGAEPETVLLTWVPPMQDWIEGALTWADGARVDADMLLAYETALTDAWHEFMP